ncbi:hypothetical protein G7Z17_g10105 [Cylindrodendrum hubeiense]|uniref:Transmembrane protein UsgS n=1 Tax=Cylindrodendrum hubeiense TaxID=595255 RepID=A0A9P5L7J2_9HYPO|nr:hypothetical protein G7Z17_g10105 [Cylindrodendrum hubeiense]
MASGEGFRVDRTKIKAAFDVSHFDINTVIRGAQLTLVGGNHYRQVAIAVAAGIAIRFIIAIPIFGIKAFLWFISLFTSLDSVTWDDNIVNSLDFVAEYVLQVPFFLMALMRYVVPTLDNLFMQSLQWVDMTYVQKHKDEKPSDLRDLYYPNFKRYRVFDGSTHSESTAQAISMFLFRFVRKGLISLAVFSLSFTPVIGRFVLPAASFYTFNTAVGLGPASVIFGTGLFLPRRYLVVFLQSYFSSRSLMRELLEPYFARVHLTKEQKRNWFHSRGGVLFGFGLGFYILIKIPLVGVLVYGIAEASTAYLITKITDPPPHPDHMKEYADSQQTWTNKHEFLDLSLANIDSLHKPKVSGKDN